MMDTEVIQNTLRQNKNQIKIKTRYHNQTCFKAVNVWQESSFAVS